MRLRLVTVTRLLPSILAATADVPDLKGRYERTAGGSIASRIAGIRLLYIPLICICKVIIKPFFKV
jgi:hypothetical protein